MIDVFDNDSKSNHLVESAGCRCIILLGKTIKR